ncbi:MAG: YihA family ribosome biogenesis GTP-binding protein [Bacteroidetes bacterium HGW-Bacteroidetes-4]|jgi:GTP-binding protein|nr:MAG: YihA family ribosome biogenesis GTP-binding protein [Bacteroidetes bacterium HGW-Bacteroidetes-4]
MEIQKAEFVISNTDYKKCPEANMPEYAFIGRSNVGKSSLINMLANHSKLAKVSGQPGKTQLINHFIIDNKWYLVDLPGYGYAKVSKKMRTKWQAFIQDYLLMRTNLYCVFVLLDSRLEPQKIDMEFLEWLGTHGIPLALAFTKADKLSKTALAKNIAVYKKELLKNWEQLPQYFITSAETKLGKEELLGYIHQINTENPWVAK